MLQNLLNKILRNQSKKFNHQVKKPKIDLNFSVRQQLAPIKNIQFQLLNQDLKQKKQKTITVNEI